MNKDQEIQEFGQEYAAKSQMPWHKRIFGGKEEALPEIPKQPENEVSELRRLVLQIRQEKDEGMSAIFSELKELSDTMKAGPAAAESSKIEEKKIVINTSNEELFDDGVVLHVPEQVFEISRKDLQDVIDTSRRIGIVISSAGFRRNQ